MFCFILNGVLRFTISSYETLHIGNSYEESLEIFSAFDAPDFERVIFQWTSGGYANTDYVIDTVNLIDEYDMWEHKFFKPYLFTLYFPRSSLSFLSNIVATVTAASITDIDSFKVWKHHGAQLSCLENFFPGEWLISQSGLFTEFDVCRTQRVPTVILGCDDW